MVQQNNKTIYVIRTNHFSDDEEKAYALRFCLENILEGRVVVINSSNNLFPFYEYTQSAPDEISIEDEYRNTLYSFYENDFDMIIAKTKGFVLSNEWKNRCLARKNLIG